MPGRIRVSESGDHFVDESGKPFFYLGDTVWSVFTHTLEEDWLEYLRYRSRQGYNVLQINILPQHDASGPGLGHSPFARGSDGSYDFTSFDESYFERAERMLESAVSFGFVPALVLLWCDYVPGTWLSKIKTGHVMPASAVSPYVEYAAKRFARFKPIYLVAGDTADSDLQIDEAWSHYETALETVKRVDPDALATLHLWGPKNQQYDLPRRFLDCEHVDFFMYQSGHGFDWIANPYSLPGYFSAAGRRRPIVNGEPCYEGIGHDRGRHDRRSVRRAVWLSLLSGAQAGVTYGAHGVWSWHEESAGFESWGGGDFKVPFRWRDALRFPGAWDVAAARWLFERFDLFDLKPAGLSAGPVEDSAVAIGGNACLIYTAYPFPVEIERDLSGYEWVVVDPERPGELVRPAVHYEKDRTYFEMPHFNSDVLFIGISQNSSQE